MNLERPVRTVFLGSGTFAVPVLEAVATHPAVELVAAVSAPDRRAGRGHRPRGVPVATLARQRGWPLHQPARLRDVDAQARLLALRPELLVLADYGQIVPAALVDSPAHGALNVHPSLLPRHRGASPVAATILAGDREGGVTVIRMDAGVDTGPIVAQARVPVAGSETAPRLEERLAALGARLLADVLEPWLGGAIVPLPQPAEGASVTRLLRREDGRLDWTRDAEVLERQVRAYQPWPGSFAPSPFGTITLWGAAVLRRDAAGGAISGRPGTVLPWERGLAVVCAGGALELLEVQLAGRGRMSGRDLRNGYPRIVGERLP